MSENYPHSTFTYKDTTVRLSASHSVDGRSDEDGETFYIDVCCYGVLMVGWIFDNEEEKDKVWDDINAEILKLKEQKNT